MLDEGFNYEWTLCKCVYNKQCKSIEEEPVWYVIAIHHEHMIPVFSLHSQAKSNADFVKIRRQNVETDFGIHSSTLNMNRFDTKF